MGIISYVRPSCNEPSSLICPILDSAFNCAWLHITAVETMSARFLSLFEIPLVVAVHSSKWHMWRFFFEICCCVVVSSCVTLGFYACRFWLPHLGCLGMHWLSIGNFPCVIHIVPPLHCVYPKLSRNSSSFIFLTYVRRCQKVCTVPTPVTIFAVSANHNK